MRTYTMYIIYYLPKLTYTLYALCKQVSDMRLRRFRRYHSVTIVYTIIIITLKYILLLMCIAHKYLSIGTIINRIDSSNKLVYLYFIDCCSSRVQFIMIYYRV